MKTLFKFSILFITLIWLAPALSKQDAPDSIPGTTKVSAEDVVQLVTSKSNLVIIDARKDSDRSNSGWIEGSIGLPNTDTTPESLAKYLPSKSTPVLFYCNGVKCGRSVESSNIALKAGYTEVYWFRGGWEEWTGKGLPVSKN